eukprot:s122_g9.t1
MGYSGYRSFKGRSGDLSYVHKQRRQNQCSKMCRLLAAKQTLIPDQRSDSASEIMFCCDGASSYEAARSSIQLMPHASTKPRDPWLLPRRHGYEA